MDPSRMASVLAGLAYPASTWQLLAQADYYGADFHSRKELGRLPVAVYPNLEAVISVLRRLEIRNREQAVLATPAPEPAEQAGARYR